MKPYVQTYSVCVGGNDCNANCPYCVAKMTNPMNKKKINMRNLMKGAELAKLYGASTALITGKGEPTLHMDEVIEVINNMASIFPLVEMQTNGITLDNNFVMEKLYNAGLTTICLSAVHWKKQNNQEVIGRAYRDIAELKGMCEDNGIALRLTVMLMAGQVDTIEKIDELIDYCRKQKIEQLTIRTLAVSEIAGNKKIADWINSHKIDMDYWMHVEMNGKLLNSLVHGARVYDVNGQNVCVSNCLTMEEKTNDIRQLIYCSDGHIRYDWQYKGAIII